MTSATMAAMVLTGHGGPERLEYRAAVARPEPGPGEVLVRLRASAVNNTDIAFRENWYGDDSAQAWPRIQGAGGAGVVHAVGAGVDDGLVGEVVVVDPFLRRPGPASEPVLDVLLGSVRDGCFAEFVAVPEDGVIAVRSGLTFAELACLPTAFQTAEEMQLRAGLSGGHTVIVTGASGGVGAANVELAHLRGAQVIAVTDAAKAEEVAARGADRVVDRLGRAVDSGLEIEAAVAEVILDVTGGAMVQFWLERLRPGGVYVTAGAIAGWSAAIDLRTVIYHDLTIIGQVVARRAALENLAELAASGRLRPRVAAVFPLAELAEAQRRFLAKDFVGKVVIDIEEASAVSGAGRGSAG